MANLTSNAAAPAFDRARLEQVVSKCTAFSSFDDLLNARGEYRPTIHLVDADHVFLAAAYDAAQSARGDARRAYTRPAPDAPKAAAPVWVAGDDITVEANQGDRPGIVLAVMENRMLVEYEMPKGTTALMYLEIAADWTLTQARKSTSYKGCPRKWLVAIQAAGMEWTGNGQQGGKLSFARALELAGLSTPAK